MSTSKIRAVFALAMTVALAGVSPASAVEHGGWLEHLDRTHGQIDAKRHVRSYGEIVSIDTAQRELTLQHVPIASPDKLIRMPVMIMIFRVTSKNKLNSVKVGDWVSFEAVRIKKALVVTNLRKVGLEGSRGNMLLW